MAARPTKPVQLRLEGPSELTHSYIKRAYKYMGYCEEFRGGQKYKFVEPDGTVIWITNLQNRFKCLIVCPDLEEEEEEKSSPEQGLCVSYTVPPIDNRYEYTVFDYVNENKFIATEVKVPQSDDVLDGVELIYTAVMNQPPMPNLSFWNKGNDHLVFSSYNVTREDPWAFALGVPPATYEWGLTEGQILNTDLVNKYLMDVETPEHWFLGEYRLIDKLVTNISSNPGYVWMHPFVYKPEEPLAEDTPITCLMITSEASLDATTFYLQRVIVPGYFNKPLVNEVEIIEGNPVIQPIFETIAQTTITGKDTIVVHDFIELSNKFNGWAEDDGTTGYLVGSSRQMAFATPFPIPTESKLKVWRFNIDITPAEETPDNQEVVNFTTTFLPDYSTANWLFPVSLSNGTYVSASSSHTSKSYCSRSDWKMVIDEATWYYTFVLRLSDGQYTCVRDAKYPIMNHGNNGLFGFEAFTDGWTINNGNRGTCFGESTEQDDQTKEASSVLVDVPRQIIGVVPDVNRSPVEIVTGINGSGDWTSTSQVQDTKSGAAWAITGITAVPPQGRYSPDLWGGISAGDAKLMANKPLKASRSITGTCNSNSNADYTIDFDIGGTIVPLKYTLNETISETGSNTKDDAQATFLFLAQFNLPVGHFDDHRAPVTHSTKVKYDSSSDITMEGMKILYVDLKNDIILLETTKFRSTCSAAERTTYDTNEIEKTGTYTNASSNTQSQSYTAEITLKLELIYNGKRSELKKYSFSGSASNQSWDKFRALLGEAAHIGVGEAGIHNNAPWYMQYIITYYGGIPFYSTMPGDRVTHNVWFPCGTTTSPYASDNCDEPPVPIGNEEDAAGRCTLSEYEADGNPGTTVADLGINGAVNHDINIYLFLQRMRFCGNIDGKLEQSLRETWGSVHERCLEQGSIFAQRIEVSAFTPKGTDVEFPAPEHHILLTTHGIEDTLGSGAIQSEEILIVNGVIIPNEGSDAYDTIGVYNTRTSFVT